MRVQLLQDLHFAFQFLRHLGLTQLFDAKHQVLRNKRGRILSRRPQRGHCTRPNFSVFCLRQQGGCLDSAGKQAGDGMIDLKYNVTSFANVLLNYLSEH
jgi:hypothetical protein